MGEGLCLFRIWDFKFQIRIIKLMIDAWLVIL